MKRPWHRQTSGMGRSRQSQADNLDRYFSTSDDGFELKMQPRTPCGAYSSWRFRTGTQPLEPLAALHSTHPFSS